MSPETPNQVLIARADASYDGWEAGTLSYEQALQTIEDVIAAAREQDLKDALLSGMNNKAILLRDTGLVEAALVANKQLLELAQQENNTRYLSYATFANGDIYRVQGRSELARKAFRDAYKFADAAQDYLAAAYALHSEARIVLVLQQAAHAKMLGENGLAYIERYLKATAQPDPIYSSLQSGLYQLLARCEFKEGRVEVALEFAQKALERAQRRNSSLEIGNTYCVFAELASQPSLGLNIDDSYTKALRYHQMAGAEVEFAETQYMYGKSLYERGRNVEAVTLLEDSCRLFKKLQHGADFLRASKLLMTCRGQM